jgi:hypothetical protein
LSRLRDVDILRKKRDIARAHERREGAVAVLAERFHASSTTVRDAIAHDEAYWQAEVDAVQAGSIPARRYLYAWITLERRGTGAGGQEWEVRAATVKGSEVIPGVIDGVLNEIARRGWEIVQVATDAAAEPKAVLVRRPRA